jgi:hypothetical protein
MKVTTNYSWNCKKYEFLPNGNNSEKTDAFFVVVEIVSKDQDKRSKSS